MRIKAHATCEAAANSQICGWEERSRKFGLFVERHLCVRLIPHARVWITHSPHSESLSAPQCRQQGAAIHELEVGMSGEDVCDHRLIFERIEGARRVHETSTRCEQCTRTLHNQHLQRMHVKTLAEVPTAPKIEIFAHCAITTARNITQNSIIEKWKLSIATINVWKELCLIMSDDKSGTVQRLSTMNEHISTLTICVVRYNKSCGETILTCTEVQSFEKLRGL
jgi:hypothetical protein